MGAAPDKKRDMQRRGTLGLLDHVSTSCLPIYPGLRISDTGRNQNVKTSYLQDRWACGVPSGGF